jgi:hypothetical protein
MRRALFIIVLCFPILLKAQIAGRSTYNFLQLPVSARVTGLGGAAYAVQTGDPALVLSNPALISKENHQQVAFNTAFYLAGTNFGSVNYTHFSDKLKTGFNAGVLYTSYGRFDGRDPAGNPTGDFRAGDVSLAGSFARYWKRFSYGVQMKLIFSGIEQYHSFGIATDWAANYTNEEKQFTAAFLLRNVGGQITPYVAGGEREALPVDLSLAMSKRFERLPFRLQVVAHNLQKWDITAPEQGANNFLINSGPQERGFIDKLFAHIILGGEIEAGKPFRLRFGYNHLVRQALANPEKKGFSGFSGGIGIVVQQFTIDYGISSYHPSAMVNHIGFSVNLKDWGNKTN